jgi:hypothetical protein
MPGTTPNFDLRFPTDGDAVNIAGDIENLAMDADAAIDGTATSVTTEATARINADNALETKIEETLKVVAPPGVIRIDKILIQSHFAVLTTDGFASSLQTFPVPYVGFDPPAVVVSNVSDIAHVMSVSTISNTSALITVRHTGDGLPAASEICGFCWIAVGFSEP